MPRVLILPAVLLVLLALVPFALIAKSRGQPSTSTRLAIIQDMGHQPKFGAQAATPLFADGRSMRPPVDGTVARGELREDPRLNRGLEADGKFVKLTPMPVTKERLRRGQERFEIFCAPCHGLAGYGNGIVTVRSAELAEQGQAVRLLPKSYHVDEVRVKESGSYFNTITKGQNAMPPYAAQISVEDRWAIVMYVRALQRSQWANVEDVPPEKREDLR
jgi:mono/diheme cytochrome c family protein